VINIRVYEFFEFYENNFEKVVERFHELMKVLLRQGISVKILREFPPCVMRDLKDIDQTGSIVKLSKTDFLINNNMYFGKDYMIINAKFTDSPFICVKCKKCNYFKKHLCRGIFNNRFLKMKERISRIRGEKQYSAMRFEYFKGNFGLSSRCNCDCIFCGAKDEKYLEFVDKEVSKEELLHFSHYVDRTGVIRNLFFYKVVSGEPLFHKNIEDMLMITRLFTTGSIFSVNTNGLNLNENIIKILSKFRRPFIHISVNVSDPELRKKRMNYDCDFDLISIFNNLKKYHIEFIVTLLVLKDDIETDNLEKTILFLKNHISSSNMIIILEVMYNKFSLCRKKDLIDYEHECVEKYLVDKGIKDYVSLEWETNSLLFPKLDYISAFIKDNLASKKVLVLSPDISFEYLSRKMPQNVTIRSVSNSIGIKKSISESIGVNEYLAVYKTENPTLFDVVILPLRSFDEFMNDINNINVNQLFDNMNKKIVYLL